MSPAPAAPSAARASSPSHAANPNRFLNDPRDVVFVRLSAAITLVQLPCAIALFVVESVTWWLAAGYWLLWGCLFMDRYILMLHATAHRPLFRREWRFLNRYIPWVIGPFCGETPESYFAHHLGMHHKEENLSDDLSSTMPYRRDSFRHWLRYFLRFLLLCLPELVMYLLRKRRQRLAYRVAVGELGFWAAVLVLGHWVSWEATLVVLVAPVVVVRTLMMIGNWGQHAFVDPAAPANSYRNSITCINTRYNRRCFNDGYHIVHHLKPGLHFTEMALEFEQNQRAYGEQDAIVFDGIDFFGVWWCLMTKRWRTLVRRFVHLPGAPPRDDAQVLALLRSRLLPISERASA
jgi:fatty acid desaturase